MSPLRLLLFAILLATGVGLGVDLGVGAPVQAQGRDPDLSLPDTIRQIKPSIVGVGSYDKLRRPPLRFRGTGFVVADGRHVLTNAHVVNFDIDPGGREFLAVFVGSGDDVRVRRAEKVAIDGQHDVALLRISGPPLPAMKLGNDEDVSEGQKVAFTGFPIGSVLGLYPATHRGIVAARTPIAIPQFSTRPLDAAMIRSLRTPFLVFQLDATAYPGNSGSPLYDPRDGRVYGIVSSVFVKRSKEKVLSDPSGITYAVLIRYARVLLEQAGLQP